CLGAKPMLAVRTRDGTKPAGKKDELDHVRTWHSSTGVGYRSACSNCSAAEASRGSERRCAVRVIRWENCGKVISGGILSKRSGSIRSPKTAVLSLQAFRATDTLGLQL